MNGYLSKPVAEAELFLEIRRLLTR